MDVVNGETETRHWPPEEILKWPLEVGKEWEQTFTAEKPKERQTNERERACKIETKENVTVPAGMFETFGSPKESVGKPRDR
jgi:hypothetical protein